MPVRMPGDEQLGAVAGPAGVGTVSDRGAAMSAAARMLAYGVGPVALVVLVLLQRYGLVADVPVWEFAVAIVGSMTTSRFVERWQHDGPGTFGMHVRIAAHMAAVTSVIYLSGWGPALGMAYAFTAFADLEQSGAGTWTAATGWSFVGIGVGQSLIALGWAPSMFQPWKAQTIGLLGAFVMMIAVRMAGATGAQKELAEARLAHQATHDSLTGLVNRSVLVDRLSRANARRHANDADAPAVMFLDLNRFKGVNDTFGHQAGDQLLREVARRLELVMGADDTIARFGGDEFVVLCEHATAQRIDEIIAGIDSAFAESFTVENEQLRIGVSVGVTIVDDQITSVEALLSEADAAMYFAKSRGGTGKRVVFFDELTRRHARTRVRTEADLAYALERNELVLYYQPVFDVGSGEPIGVEALLRWNHPQRGLLLPEEFLEAAERTGLIVAMGEWVIREACTTVSSWNAARPAGRELHLSVNLSPSQLADPGLVDHIARVLAATRLLKSENVRFGLELTDSAVNGSSPVAKERFAALDALGVKLAMDDFGSGSASLSCMKDLPIRVVKIDRSFIRALDSDDRVRTIVAGMIEFAHRLDLRVVAEGVEQQAQYDILRALGCDYAQGFLLGEPQPAPVLTSAFMLDRYPNERASSVR
ncbi:MAG TPA: bifunctional diguanylate cyclase/phosphodiesterase [Acidimicrobiia bacterium]|nr:bifunctional diguanylate cyclase/phosphodiesterase [Acidimicrobiia bacterium]